MKEGLRVKQRGKEIRNAIAHNKSLLGKYSAMEGRWGRDSDLSSFGATLFHCLPELGYKPASRHETGQMVRRYIESVLSNNNDGKPLTAVELGGPGSSLFQGFSKNFFARTAGVCLKDIRSEKNKEEDDKVNHHIISGKDADILDVENPKYLSLIKSTLGVEKTNLIISRMMSPLEDLSKDPLVLDRTIRNWYRLLGENSLLFVQFQTESESAKSDYLENTIKEWARLIGEKCPEVEIQVGYKALRLHKKIGAPEELPPATQLFG